MSKGSEDSSMPIAVIGMGCRFPGDATSPEKLWDVLADARSEWSEFPKDRINIDGFYHPSGDRQGSINFRGGHFLSSDVAAWDAPFFSITAQEAAAMDPQQRILLEVSYEALENAGIPIESLPGSATAVYCGSFVKDYEQICLRDPDDSPIYAATGNGIAIMSNRISWFYDLRGPSMTLDTGCSASLVGVHLACQSLRTGESKLAIAAGAGLILTPSTMMPMTALNFLSPDGKCFTFDERANGYGRGEGIGMVVLKPLEDALRDNDTIRAVIRGSGVNQDGRTPGITVPSKESQVDNIRNVYKTAGLDYKETAYCEAHGTGTQVGDPAELGAIGEIFSSTRTSSNPLYVGSVKTNIGHLEGCAGIAGLMKGVLTLEKGLIPQNLWFESCNTKISLQEGRIKVPTEITPWPVGGLRRASINCFGFGGTNAHIILDDAFHYLSKRGLHGNHSTIVDSMPTTPTSEDSFVKLDDEGDFSNFTKPRRKRLYVLSSHEQIGIDRLVNIYSQYLQEHAASALSDNILRDFSYTLGCRRSMLPWRSFAIASSLEELQNNLSLATTKPIRSSSKPRVAFVFTGQGAQWYKMGRELLVYHDFSLSINEADIFLKDFGCEWSLMDELLKDEEFSRINSPGLSQPLCTALQIALTDLLKTWNILPYAVVGHSSGEIAAAYCKGAITKRDACRLAYHRGRTAESLSGIAPAIKGRMMAVALSAKDVEEHCKFVKATNNTLDIACINSDVSTTVSGDENAILELKELLVSKGIDAQLLAVTMAYHSGHMNLIKDTYLEAIKDTGSYEANPACQMFSSVTGSELSDKDLAPSYWSKNLVSPVRFSDAMQSLMATAGRPDVFVEIGPHSTLRSPILQILEAQIKRGTKPAYLSVLRRGMEATISALDMAGQLWNRGYPVDLACINNFENSSVTERPKVLTDLPNYPWNHSKSYWHESHLSKAHRFRKYGRRDLLGSPTADSTSLEPRWRGFLRLSENPWMQDHQIQNSILYPAAGMVVMVLEAASQIKIEGQELKGYELRNINIIKPMIIPATTNGLETALNIRTHKQNSPNAQSESTWFDFTITSYNAREEWEEHCNGLLRIKYAEPNGDGPKSCHSDDQRLSYKNNYLRAQDICTETLSPRQLYETLESVGMKYGPLFRNIINIRKSRESACTTIRLPETKSTMQAKFEYPHLIHPATLDALFQTVFVAGKEPMLPAYIESLYVSSDIPQEAGAELYGYSSAARLGLREAIGTVVMSDKQWKEPKIIMKGFKCVALAVSENPGSTEFLANNQKLCTEGIWKLLSNASDSNDFDESAEVCEKTQLKPSDVTSQIQLLRPKISSKAVLDFSRRISDRLSAYGYQVHITSLSEADFEGKLCISLLEVEDPFICSWSIAEYDQFKDLVNRAKGCLWVTRGGQMQTQNPLFGTILGLFRTIRSEDSLKRLYTLDISTSLESEHDDSVTAVISTLIAVFDNSTVSEETEYAELDGKLYVPRIVLTDGLNAMVDRGTSPNAPELLEFHQTDRSLALGVGTIGRLESLQFGDNEEHEIPLGPDEAEVLVKAVGVNRTDVMTVMGQTSNATIGQDVAGLITRLGSNVTDLRVGERVVCFALNAYRTHVRTNHAMVKLIPPGLSLEQAASLPTSYATAYYSLIDVGRLQKNESVFIHDATSDLGQAAIQISLWVGAEIFVSVASDEEKHLLTKYYGLEKGQMFGIHQDDFVDGLKHATGGQGVDVIVTAAMGDTLRATWECIDDYGRFISLSKSEGSNSRPDIVSSRHNIIFSSPDIEHLIKFKPLVAGRLLDSTLELIACGSVREIEPLHILDLSQIADAFREVYSGQHTGKLVLQVNDNSLVPIVPIDPHPIRLHGNATYVLVGGLGGLGRSLAKLLVGKGARFIAFISRSGADTEEKLQLLNLLESQGCQAKSYSCDICDKAQLAMTLELISSELTEIRGVIQAAAVIKDGIFDNLTFDDFVAVTKPKIQGSWNLHEILTRDLDFFVMLSSSAGVIGSRGQANYAAGNSFQDALSYHRRSQGLASVTLDLGMILGAGMVAENEQTLDMLRASGFFGIREEDFHTLISSAITGFSVGESRVPPQVIIGTGTGGLVKQNKVSDPYWYREARFSIMRGVDVEDSETVSVSSSSVSALLTNTNSVSEAADIICTGLAVLLSKTLSMPLEDLDVSKAANAYGVDSLVVVGIRNWILRETNVDVSIFEILSEISVEGLSLIIAEKCLLVVDEN